MAKKIDVWTHNFAENAKIRSRVQEFFSAKLKQVKREREEMNQKNLEFFRMWNVEKDGNNYYNGRAKLYIPEVRKNVESQARHLVEAAFGNEEDLFDVIPEATGTFDGAEIHKTFRMHQIQRAKLRHKYHVFCRQSCLYGTAPVMIDWRRVARRVFMSKNEKGKIVPHQKVMNIFDGPDFINLDLFRWYALNPMKEDVQEDGFAYYDLVDPFELIRREKAGRLRGRERIEQGGPGTRKDELEDYIERMEAQDIVLEDSGSAGEASFRRDREAHNGRVMCATIFTSIELPEACLPDEDSSLPIPVEIQIYNDDEVGLIKRNGFYHQAPPCLVGKYILPNPGQMYGQGIPWAIQYMQHEINTKAEQSMDSATLALNPLAFIDPAMASNMGEYAVEPGAVWFVNPNGVKLAQLPDVTGTGYAAIAQLSAQMANYSDRSPALPSQLMGKSRSATQSSIVSESLQVDTDAFHKQNEELVLEPMLEMMDSLTDQNVTEDQIITVLGEKYKRAQKMLIEKKNLIGQYRYKWKSRSVLQNRQITARQVIDFFKIVAVMPPEDKMRLGFRQDEAAKMLWRDLLTLPNASRIFGQGELEKIDPIAEFKMFKMGAELVVHAGDDDDLHMRAHDAQLADKKLSDEQKNELMLHSKTHEMQKAMKIELARQRKQAQMELQAEGQKQPEQGGGAVGSGNRTQLSPNGNPGDMGSGMRA